METRLVAGETGIAEAVGLLKSGEVVGFPTETVYGLGGDARSDAAVKRIYEVKGRPGGNPVIVHAGSLEEARGCAADWPEVAEALAKKFWPGPLTVIVKRAAGISALVSAGRETVALRCPAHGMALELLRRFDGPIAAPSANRSGFTSPTTAAHVMAELSGRVPLILDGGACAIGVESTVVDLSGKAKGGAAILRPGAVTAEMLREVVGEVKVVRKTVGEGEAAESPGMHSRHYAPRHAAFRFGRGDWEKVKAWAEANGPVALLSFVDDVMLAAPHETIQMPAGAGDYARVMFAAMREADERDVKAILVLMPEGEAGMWAAVTDRLRRATLPMKTT